MNDRGREREKKRKKSIMKMYKQHKWHQQVKVKITKQIE
jgi:hypothetical protein